jgi:hypothetical protein
MSLRCPSPYGVPHGQPSGTRAPLRLADRLQPGRRLCVLGGHMPGGPGPEPGRVWRHALRLPQVGRVQGELGSRSTARGAAVAGGGGGGSDVNPGWSGPLTPLSCHGLEAPVAIALLKAPAHPPPPHPSKKNKLARLPPTRLRTAAWTRTVLAAGLHGPGSVRGSPEPDALRAARRRRLRLGVHPAAAGRAAVRS